MIHVDDPLADIVTDRPSVRPSLEWRNAVLIALMFVSLLLIVRHGRSVGMHWYLSPRYWSYAIPSYFSEIEYGGPRYTYFMDLAVHFVSTPPFGGDVATFQALLWDAAAGRVPVSGPPHLFPADEKGTVEFVKLAFAVFGIRVQSLFFLYCSLLALSLSVFACRFRHDSQALLIGLVSVAALYVTIRTFPMTKELFSVTNPRAIGSLGVVPLLHLLLVTLKRDRPTPTALAQVVFQALLLVFVVSMRTSETWQFIALIGTAAIAVSRRGTRADRLSALWPAATILVIVAIYVVYQSYAFPQEYFSKNLRTKILWHNVLIGFAVHPGIAEAYHLRLDDPSALTLARAKAREDSSFSPEEIFWSAGDRPDGMVKNFREYERLCRTAVWDIVIAHPRQALELFTWYKARLLVRSFEYAAGHVTHELNYYLLEDQAVSLFTPREREATGAFYNPLSPIPFLLVLAASVAAGVLRAKEAFNSNVLAALVVTVCASVVPAFATYPLIHVIAGTYWAAALVFYALAIRFGSDLVLSLGHRTA